MMSADTYRRWLWELALDQYGYVTTADAVQLGIPPIELRKLAYRGTLENVTRGLYRFPDAPRTDRDSFMEAVLWVGQDAALAQDAVLALHNLGLVNPPRLRVVTAHRVRKTHPRMDVAIIHEKIPPDELTDYFGIPTTTMARALLDSGPLVMRDRLLEAAHQARQQGLLSSDEYDMVVNELKAEA